MILRGLVLDAGPVISLFTKNDIQHQMALQGFQQLSRVGIRPIIPECVVFEVYKRLRYSIRNTRSNAKDALALMLQTLEIEYGSLFMLLELQSVTDTMPDWKGSLEDAAVAVTAKLHRAHVWTFNYRDLAAFQDLEFWTPESG
jgi:predicted nucleic acid-binding protein